MIYRSLVMQIAVVGTVLSNIIYLVLNYNDIEQISIMKSSIAITLGFLYVSDLYLIKQGKKFPVIEYVVCIGFVLLAFIWKTEWVSYYWYYVPVFVYNTALWKLLKQPENKDIIYHEYLNHQVKPRMLSPWPLKRYICYNGNAVASLFSQTMLLLHIYTPKMNIYAKREWFSFDFWYIFRCRKAKYRICGNEIFVISQLIFNCATVNILLPHS